MYNNIAKFSYLTCTQRNLFEILLNHPEIRLCLPIDWSIFRLIWNQTDCVRLVPNQSERGANTI